MSKQIYLDNAATTRVDAEVFEAMKPFFCEQYGNAAAKYYSLGQFSRKALQDARMQIGELIGVSIDSNPDAPYEIHFTSCGTESDNWALMAAGKCTQRQHIITTSIEHHAVLETIEFMENSSACKSCQAHSACDVTYLPVDSGGIVNPDDLKKALRKETTMVSVMHANNEVGAIQPLKELAAITHENSDALFHTDAVQTVGKIPVNVKDLGIDLLSMSAHKFHGPKGIGALYVKKGTRMGCYMHGGGQERGLRAGTSNVAGIVGMGKAAEIAGKRIADGADAKNEFALVEKLWQGLSENIPQIFRNGNPDTRLPGTLNVRLNGAEGEAILMRLDMCGIQVSSGSACSTSSLEPSHVLLAIGIAQEDAHGSIRFSLSHETTEEDIDYVIETMPKQVKTIRDMSVTWKG